ncbi:CBS domain-containing protein [Candidatus Bathyarchaeota archaeon]|nr:MAG: CBS domain-containing protein [Candidatus Bathyarchaeota archaeon]
MSGERPMIKVRDVMKTPVITVFENENVLKTSKLMLEHNIGSVVVIDLLEKPIGIITGKDIASRVVAKSISPSKIKNREVMSHPVVIVSPNIGLDEAAKRMKKFGVDRLLVMEGGKIVGIITSAEILNITPALLEVALERLKTGSIPVKNEKISLTGYCEACGEWSDMLVEVNGKYLCEECVIELGEEET